jgi:glycosyltransferase involved in cell wall biosynthesis/Flp pilus assembly protein TadD
MWRSWRQSWWFDLSRRRQASHALTAADGARDAGDWHAAVRLYPAYLALRPDHAGVWVQLGNVQKDTGDPVAAEASYWRAITLQPKDPDAPFQLGHALRMQGRLAEAREAFARSAQLGRAPQAMREIERIDTALAPELPIEAAAEIAQDPLSALRRRVGAAPDDPAAQRDLAEALLGLGRFEEAAAAAESAWRLQPDFASHALAQRCGAETGDEGDVTAPLLLDIADLLLFLEESARVTGIQRVQLGLIEGILGDDQWRSETRFTFLTDPAGPVWALETEDVRRLFEGCLSTHPDASSMRALVAAARGRARRVNLAGTRAYVFVGCFWYLADGAIALRPRLRRAGARLGALIHDIIPITHPQHVEARLVEHFRAVFAAHAAGWDFALTVSKHTARELRRILPGFGISPAPPTRPVPLAHRLNARAMAPGEAWPPALSGLQGRDFVLCVGTLEARKNHLALFQAWSLMREEGPPPPPLVLVGRPGWRVGDLMEQLAATDHLDGLIHVLDTVSDPELEALYRACLFTVFPSFTEGWGLPVGESLAAGKLCLASTEGATPEAGAGFADPVDPYDVRGLARRIRHWSTDRAALAAAEERILAGFRPRGWPEVTADFLAGIEESLAQPPRHAGFSGFRLPEAAAFSLRDGGAAFRAALAGDWALPEPVQSWLIGRRGGLRLEMPPGEAVLVLRFEAVPWVERNAAHIRVEGHSHARIPLHASHPAFLALPIAADGPRHLDIEIEIEGALHPMPPEGRPIRFGLSGLRHFPGPPLALEPLEILDFATMREGEPGHIDAWRSASAGVWGAASPDGVRLLGAADLRFTPLITRPQRVRVQLVLDVAMGEAGLLHLALGDEHTQTPLPALSGPVLAAIEVEASPGEPLALRLTPPPGREMLLRSLRWAEAGVEGRIALLEAILQTPLTGLVDGRTAARGVWRETAAMREAELHRRLAILRRA